MGIQGLLKGLSDFVEKRSVREFANQSLAVDTSSWLHKSVYSISHEYVEAAERSRVNPDQKCVHVSKRYIIKRCEELFANAKIKRIYLVMDGKRCPLKAVTNDDREQRRQANLKEAREYNRCGRRDKAEEKYKTCIKIHANFANAVVRLVDDYFRRRGATLKIIQSPYEADAQLVKLCVDQLADAIITEVSSLSVLFMCIVSFLTRD